MIIFSYVLFKINLCRSKNDNLVYIFLFLRFRTQTKTNVEREIITFLLFYCCLIKKFILSAGDYQNDFLICCCKLKTLYENRSFEVVIQCGRTKKRKTNFIFWSIFNAGMIKTRPSGS